MKQYPFPKSRWLSAAFTALLFSLLLLCRDTLLTALRLGFFRAQFGMLAIMVLVGIAFLGVNRRQLRQIARDRRTGLMGAFALIYLLAMVCKRDWQMMYLSVALCPVFAIFLTFFTDSCRVSRAYLKGLTVLAAYSLIATYGLRELAWKGIFIPPVRTNSAGMEFYDYILCFAGVNPYWHRNFGIFREPGVYQFFLILGLYANHYLASWDRAWKTWLICAVLALTMVTTFSVPGLIELVLFAVFVYFDRGYYRTKPGKWAGLCVIGLVVLLAIPILAELKTGKIASGTTVWFEFYDIVVRLTTDSESLLDRFSAYLTDIALFSRHPLLGADFAAVLHGTNHNTSSTLILFAAAGLLGGAAGVIVWVGMLWDKKRNLFGNLILLGILFLSFNTQNLVADLFFWLFPCMEFAQRVLPKIQKTGEDG